MTSKGHWWKFSYRNVSTVVIKNIMKISSKTQLLSNSSDGTVRLWSPGAKSPLLNTFTADTGNMIN
jgi:hypothetical protein